MAYCARIVLVSRSGYQPALDDMVETFIRDDVRVVAVTGVDCGLVEDIIDELVVGDASDDGRYLLTTAHQDEPLEAVIEFAKSLNAEIGFEDRGKPVGDDVQVVYL